MIYCIQSNSPPAQLVIGTDSKFSLMPMRMLPQWCRHFALQALQPKLIPAVLQQRTKEERKENGNVDKTQRKMMCE